MPERGAAGVGVPLPRGRSQIVFGDDSSASNLGQKFGSQSANTHTYGNEGQTHFAPKVLEERFNNLSNRRNPPGGRSQIQFG